jgi:hypothetical protein
MKNLLALPVLFALAALAALSACDAKKSDNKPVAPLSQNTQQTAPPIAPGTPLPPNHPDIGVAADPTAALSSTIDSVQTQQATIISVIDIPQFTFLEVKQGKNTRWLAAATLTAKKGDTVLFDEGSTMSTFTSKSLNRTFSNITFVNNASIKGK